MQAHARARRYPIYLRKIEEKEQEVEDEQMPMEEGVEEVT